MEKMLRELAEDHPALEPLLADHLEYFQEMLPHLLLSDVIRWLATHLFTDREEVISVLGWLEARYLSDSEIVRELIIVSGVDMIPNPGEPGSDLRDMLGPALRARDFYFPTSGV